MSPTIRVMPRKSSDLDSGHAARRSADMSASATRPFWMISTRGSINFCAENPAPRHIYALTKINAINAELIITSIKVKAAAGRWDERIVMAVLLLILLASLCRTHLLEFETARFSIHKFPRQFASSPPPRPRHAVRQCPWG